LFLSAVIEHSGSHAVSRAGHRTETELDCKGANRLQIQGSTPSIDRRAIKAMDDFLQLAFFAIPGCGQGIHRTSIRFEARRCRKLALRGRWALQ
jgi:hypothetical protein